MDKFVPGYIVKSPIKNERGETVEKKWTIGQKIGTGGFSQVYEITPPTGAMHAVKIIAKARLKKDDAKV